MELKVGLAKGVYVVAVSGGVDSVVLLDVLAQYAGQEIIVAHFDHGIREDSAADAAFVAQLAASYGLTYVAKREELGRGVSEERARERRYKFLRSVVARHRAILVTAHHADDIVETIAINSMRGTGWRGLAVLDSPDIVRPLLPYRKQELLIYAEEHQLVWHEDSTNSDETYLRNKLRARISRRLDDDSIRQLLALRDHQVETKRAIDEEVARLLGTSPYSRYFFSGIPEAVALEFLRRIFIEVTGVSPTIPQRSLALMAIKVAKPGTTHDVGAGVRLVFTSRNFTVVDG